MSLSFHFRHLVPVIVDTTTLHFVFSIPSANNTTFSACLSANIIVIIINHNHNFLGIKRAIRTFFNKNLPSINPSSIFSTNQSASSIFPNNLPNILQLPLIRVLAHERCIRLVVQSLCRDCNAIVPLLDLVVRVVGPHD